VETLLSWIADDTALTIAATNALGAIGDRRAFDTLLTLLDHEETTVRQSAVSALNSIGHPRMEQVVAGLLHSDRPRVRESAARIAGYFGYRSCLRQMVELCEDDEEIVRRAAVEHLASFDERAAWSKIIEVARSDRSPTVQSAAVRALGHVVSPESLATLVTAVGSRNLWVRYFAVRALGRQGVAHADALTGLAEAATRDPAPPVRIAAIESLGALGATSMAQVLLALTRDADIDVACAAVTALASFPSEGTEAALRFALDSGRLPLARCALDTLAAQRAVHAVPVLAALVRERRDDDFRRDAVQTLGRIGGRDAADALLQFRDDPRLRRSVIAALSDVGTAALPALDTADEDTRRTVIEALARSSDPAAPAGLATALGDPSGRVRAAAERALARHDRAALRR
jgi:HEAT repeat protein